MKILFTLLLSIILTDIFLCQVLETGCNKISPETSAFFEHVLKMFDDHHSWKIEPDSNELKIISAEYYNSVANDPAGFNAYMTILFRKGKVPGVLLSKLRDKISSLYSYPYADLITTPYLIRVKVLDKVPSQVEMNEGIKASKINLVSIVEDVIKGKNRFKLGDTIRIGYMNSWPLCMYTPKSFETGNSYFVPVTIWDGDECNELRLDFLCDECPVYPIENEMIYTPIDYFDIGDITPWQEFRTKIINYYASALSDTFASFIKKRSLKRTMQLNCEELQHLSELSQNNTTYDFVGEMPRIIGGDNIITSSIIYPPGAKENKIEGGVLVEFFIDHLGNVRCPEVIKDTLGYGCSDEALRVVSQLKFTPARFPAGCKPVIERMRMPVKFRIKSDD